jgi:hypothetical protein
MAQPVERQIVQRARALIATPQTWTQDEFARDRCGEPVSWRSPEAVQFCIWGALNRAAREMTGDEHQRVRLADHAARTLRGMPEPLPPERPWRPRGCAGAARHLPADKRGLAPTTPPRHHAEGVSSTRRTGNRVEHALRLRQKRELRSALTMLTRP